VLLKPAASLRSIGNCHQLAGHKAWACEEERRKRKGKYRPSILFLEASGFSAREDSQCRLPRLDQKAQKDSAWG
jgi:hypothetical protein